MFVGKSVFVKTTDWWCGNYYEDGTSFYGRYGMQAEHPDTSGEPWSWQGLEYVELKLLDNRTMRLPEHRFIRVCIWGNDDLGMEKDFDPDQYDAALELYEDLLTSPVISFELCKSKGMTLV